MRGFIYKTTNNINGMIYIGQTIRNVNKKYFGSGSWLKDVIKGIGEENFNREILIYCSNQTSLNVCERYFIKFYRSNDRSIGYNKTDGGENPPKHCGNNFRKGIPAWNKGLPKELQPWYGKRRIWTDEQKMAASERGIKQFSSIESRKILSDRAKGNKNSVGVKRPDVALRNRRKKIDSILNVLNILNCGKS